MIKLIKTFFIIVLFTLSTSASYAAMNGLIYTSTDSLIIPTEGNWPLPPHNPPYCYDIDASNYEFGFGISVNTAGQMPFFAPPLYATFTIEFQGLPAYTHSELLTNADFDTVGMFSDVAILGAYAVYVADLSAICPAIMREGTYLFELTTPINGVQTAYPVHLFNGLGGFLDQTIFSMEHLQDSGSKYFCCDVNEPPKELLSNESDQIDAIGLNDIEKDLAINPLTVYPNPFADKIQIEFAASSDQWTRIELLNANGQVMDVLQGNQSNRRETNPSFSTTNLPSGLYLIKITTAEEVIIKQVMKSAH